jgi:superfamily II DNA or RNA helicase
MEKMYEWQKKALIAWYKAGRRGVIVAPTGAGKTLVAISVIKDALGQGCRRVLLSVPYIPILRQHHTTLLRYGIPASVYDRDKHVREGVTLATYQTSSKLPVGELEKFQLFVFDEIHHLYSADTWCRLLDYVKADGRMWIGLTATLPPQYSMDVVYRCTVEEACVQGAISSLSLTIVNVTPTRETLTQVSELDKTIESAKIQLGRLEEDDPEYDEVMRRLALLHNKRRMVIDRDRNKTEAMVNTLSRLYSEYGKVLAFTSNLASVDSILWGLREQGVPSYTYNYQNNSSSSISQWRSRGGVLIAINALDEGLNVPDCKCILISSCPKNPRRAIQRIGRGLRPGLDLSLYILQAIDECESVIEVAKKISKTISYTRFLHS